jgi:hypothetical protein
MLVRRQNAKDGLTGEEWTRDKFYKLCRTIHCQPEELAARYFIPDPCLKKWLKQDRIPAYVTLHLIFLERSYFLCSRGATLTIVKETPGHD